MAADLLLYTGVALVTPGATITALIAAEKLVESLSAGQELMRARGIE